MAHTENGGEECNQDDLGSHDRNGDRDITDFESEETEELGENKEESHYERLPEKVSLNGLTTEWPKNEEEDGGRGVANLSLIHI